MRLLRAFSRCLLPLATTGFFVLISESPAEACTCTGWSTFEEVSRSTPMIVVGRVEAVGPGRPTIAVDPTFIDLAIERVSKGHLTQPRARVWNPAAGSSCGGAFTRTSAGTRLRIALTPVVRGSVSEKLEADRNYWSIVGFKPPVGDYLVTTACADGFEVLDAADIAR